MNREALENLLRVAKDIPPDKFDMACFDGDKKCLMGYAAHDSWFKEQGWKLVEYRPDYRVPRFNDLETKEGLSRFYELDPDTTSKLFYSFGQTPQTKIAQIEQLLAGGKL